MGRKLIEVALPLDIINDASAYDKMPGIGAHPKGIHHWWARLPLPSARAILFASLVDDPSAHPDKFPTEEAQVAERERLFEIIRRLCQKKIHTKQEVFEEAYQEILKHCNGKLPTVLDPFAGGGSIPLEGMRLGLPVQASDLNPVAVLINKVQLELLPEFANQVPINPAIQSKMAFTEWKLGKGLSEDLRYYGNWINEEAKKRIGEFYPKAKHGNKENNVVAWVWARTVKCPNPACGCDMPLVRSFILSKKNPNFYSKPIIRKTALGNKITGYEVLQGTPEIKGTINRSGATCVCCNEPVKLDYIRTQGKLNQLGQNLIAIVIDFGRGKTYITAQETHEELAYKAKPEWKPETKFPTDALRDIRTPLYGILYHWQSFTDRQLLGLSTLQTIIKEKTEQLVNEGKNSEYVMAIRSLLMMAVDRMVDFNNSLCRWNNGNEKIMNLYGRQAIPMVWDYGEANLLGSTVGAWKTCYEYVADCVQVILTTTSSKQKAKQFNASKYDFSEKSFLVSTDPPYYDNIGYSDLSDFFYVWLRLGLKDVYPDLLSTVLVPKMEELVASDFRYGSKEAAKDHFEGGFKDAFGDLKKGMDPRFPLTVYYAFKQDEDEDNNDSEDENSSGINLTTGWETLLESLVSTGFQIMATWPIKASQKWRMVAMGTNSLTSYIVLACRPRPENAPSITRREYLQILKRELPNAIAVLQKSNLAPVDMAQATIGPGMGIYSRYDKIMEQDGTPMSVRTALSLINKALGEILAEQEGDFDTETRWALAWFEQNEFAAGEFGDANALALAKNTAVNALVHSGVVKSGAGKVQLIPRSELSSTWDPNVDNRVVVWEITQHLIKQLQELGEMGAAKLYKKLGPTADIARELAYHLFTICEKKGWAQEAQAYNSLVLSWNQIVSESYNIKDPIGTQGKLEF
jgi:putative DNA methylase